jgi:hypothetical protein
MVAQLTEIFIALCGSQMFCSNCQRTVGVQLGKGLDGVRVGVCQCDVESSLCVGQRTAGGVWCVCVVCVRVCVWCVCR